MLSDDDPLLNCVSHKVTIILNMFCSFVKNRVGSSVNCSLTVTEKRVGVNCSRPSSFNSFRIHFISRNAVAIDLYSASAEECDTVRCFLVFHAISDPPSITTKALSDLRVRGQDDQYASQYTESVRSGSDCSRIPRPNVPFRNRTTRSAASQ